VKQLLVATGLGAEIATWSPAVQAFAIVAVVTVLLVVLLVKSDRPAKRLVAVIRALRGRQ
jgi:hypothetical protein